MSFRENINQVSGIEFMFSGPHQPKPQVKTDATLPAYCNPPNPCPVGYTEDQGCTLDFENTASFSREYQAAQECMCDAEHMFECNNGQDGSDNGQNFQKFLAQQFHTPSEHKNLVAKKFFTKVSYFNLTVILRSFSIYKGTLSVALRGI